MKNKNVNYHKVQIGDLLLLVPDDRGEYNNLLMSNDILWSLKEFEYKVFGYIVVESVISFILQERAKSGQPFYNMELNLYHNGLFPGTLESFLKNRWTYAAMRQTYRYFDQLTKKFPEFSTTAFAVECGWSNNTRDALEIHPLDKEYQSVSGENDSLTMQFSSYTTYSEIFIEELIVKMGGCEQRKHDYEEFLPVKKENTTIVVGEHLIKEYNDFFFLKNDRVFCGLASINPKILYEVNWRVFVHELVRPVKCPHCNTTYHLEVSANGNHLDILTHHILKGYDKNVGNNIYSIGTQFINLINEEWERLKKEHPGMEYFIFDTGIKERTLEHYAILQYVDKNLRGPTKEIIYKQDSDYILQNKEDIAKSL